MNLEDNFLETMGFIYQLRRQAFELGRFSRFARSGIVADLSHCTSIDLAAALVVASEFDRIRRVYNFHPRVFDEGWCSEVKALMGQLGLYQLVEATNRSAETESLDPTSTEFVRFRSADDVNPIAASELQDEIAQKAGIEDPATLLSLEPLIEAVSNSHQHAYPDNEGNCQISFTGRWWAAGEIDRTEKTLRFAVYDQGVGIPSTLPKKTYWSLFQRLLGRLGLAESDADVIAGALEIGRSMTDLPGRGLGLDRIRKVADMLPEGRLRIWSGAGRVTYKGKEMWQPMQWERKALPVSFSGTMVEWQFKLTQAG